MMNEQSVLTKYFTAAKSNQNFHAAKRRKVVSSGGDGAVVAKPVTDHKKVEILPFVELPSASFVASPATTTSSKANKRLSRKRPAQGRRTRKNVVAEREQTEIVTSKATSIADDHQTERARKTTASKGCHDVGSEHNVKAQTSAPKSDPEKQEMAERSPAPKPVIPQEEAKPQEAIGRKSGLKINPWIQEQAKVVLVSRGRRALEKSLGSRQAESGGRSSGKVVGKPDAALQAKPAAKPGPKPGKAKQNIPKLREGLVELGKTAATSGGDSGPKVPAYQRFSHLLEAKKPKPSDTVTRSLPLPYHYKMLEEFFRCVDVVLSLKRKRYENCTFAKLKESVQEMCRKTFEKKHLAQMKTVYPNAFVFHQQSGLMGQKKSDYQLTVDFNVDDLQLGSDEKKKQFKFVESSELIARQKHFKSELLKITMKYHRDYLDKNYPSLSVKDDDIMRWHPSFRLDQVPEVTLSALPEPPHVKVYSTAQDVLDRARKNMAPRVEKSLTLIAQKSKEANAEKKKELSSENNASQLNKPNPSLKGISQSLIEKIRQKEEKKIQETLTIDPEVEQKRVMLQKLPELCRILKSYFVTERKAAIPLEDASNKLSESCTSTLSAVQVEKHLKLLCELAPESVTIMHVRKCPYVKLKKNININILVEKLKSKEIN